MTKGIGFFFYVLPLLLYCTAIFVLSSAPLPTLPDLGFSFQDKLIHMAAYFLMALLAYRALTWWGRDREWQQGRLLIIAIIFTALYGASDEIHQAFVPGRSSDVIDWVADVIGALLVIPAVRFLSRTSLYILLGHRTSRQPRT